MDAGQRLAVPELLILPPLSAPGLPISRISGPARFRRLQRPTQRARSGPLRASWVAADAGVVDLCVAYAISTASGNAVARNRIRRRLRHAVTLLAGDFPPGDLLLRVTGATEQCTWPVVLAAVTDLSRRLGGAAAGAAGIKAGIEAGIEAGIDIVAPVAVAAVIVVSTPFNDPFGL